MFRGFLCWNIFLQVLIAQRITVSLGKHDDDEAYEQHIQNHIDRHLQEQSKIISEQQKIIKFFDHLEHYHLIPQQTVYDRVDDLVTSKVISTSPPRLTIQPSAVDQSAEITMTLKTDSYSSKVQILPLKEEACISETSTLAIHPSQSLKSSISSKSEVSVLAGREQMPSKTESLNDFYEPASYVSQPSSRLVLKTSFRYPL